MYTNLLGTLRYTIKANRNLIIGAILSIGLVAMVFFSYMVSETRREYEVKLLEDADMAVLSVNGVLHQAEAVLTTISQANAVQTKDTQKSTGFLRRVSAQFPYIEAIGIADLNGDVFADSGGDHKLNIAKRSFFKGALQKDGFYVSDSLISIVDKKHIVGFSMPVKGVDGKTVGVAYAIVPLKQINETLKAQAKGKKVNIILMDTKGAILAYSNPVYTKDDNLVMADLLEVKEELGGIRGVKIEDNEAENHKDLVAYVPVPTSNWGLVVEAPVKLVYSSLLSQLFIPLILLLVLVSPSLFIFWLFLLKLGEQQKILKANNDVLARLAITDGLTGLYNHRFFQEHLEEAVIKAKEEDASLSLILLDIDYFKHFNDTFGHMAGDTVLKELASMLNSLIGEHGFVARYGGEEFAIILSGKGSLEALAKAEEIRKTVEQHSFSGKGLENGKVTLSIGLASFPEHAHKKEDLVRLADQALYKAKFSAKNKVEVYYSVLDDLKTHLNESEQNLLSSVKTLITVINAKDRYTYGHSERVLEFSLALGNCFGLDRNYLDLIKYGAFIHDIGKIEIEREILNKTGPLTADEFKVIKEHPVLGAEIVRPVDSLRNTIPIILHHHERYDGTGYPLGLKGEAIPFMARIVAVADSFDAMTTDRPYKKAKSEREALEELERCAGSQFDPAIVKVFVEMMTSKVKVS